MNSENLNDSLKNDLNKNFNLFLTELENILDDEDKLTLLREVKKKNLESNNVNENLICFHNSINSDDLFNLFVRSKIKLFSSKTVETNKISESLFGVELTLKNVFNNQPANVKKNLWKYLHLFFLLIESYQENKSNKKINKLRELVMEKEENTVNLEKEKDNLSNKNLSDRVKKDILNVEVNDTTNNMIDDIVSSFQDSLEGNSENPFNSILDITKKITDKYQDKIESGEIELDKMMNSITDTMPGMKGMVGKNKKETKETVVIDENFSTDDVKLGDESENENDGLNLSGMMKMMNNMNGKNGGPNLQGLMNVMGKLNTVQSEEDALNLKSEMDDYLEKELGVDVEKLNETMNSNITKEEGSS